MHDRDTHQRTAHVRTLTRGGNIGSPCEVSRSGRTALPRSRPSAPEGGTAAEKGRRITTGYGNGPLELEP
jgi:hypothetical protein